jgi:hypothetical protein
MQNRDFAIAGVLLLVIIGLVYFFFFYAPEPEIVDVNIEVTQDHMTPTAITQKKDSVLHLHITSPDADHTLAVLPAFNGKVQLINTTQGEITSLYMRLDSNNATLLCNRNCLNGVRMSITVE